LRTYTYDHANRLTQVVSGTLTTGFTYNGAGDRVAKTVDGVTTDYVLDPAAGLTQVLQETSGGQATSYLYGHDLLAQYDSGTWAYHVNDGLGSVRGLADPTGQVMQSHNFSPFGVPLGESGGEPYGYTGEQWDASAGLVFLRARYYQPVTGRFLTKDPNPGSIYQPQTLNPYVYVLNNPVNDRDPSGEQGENEEEERFGEFLEFADDFLLGAAYQWAVNNFNSIRFLLGEPGRSQLRDRLDQIEKYNRYSLAFQQGRLAGSLTSMVQAAVEFGIGGTTATCGAGTALATSPTGVGVVVGGVGVAVGAAVVGHSVQVGLISVASVGDIKGNIYWIVGEGGGRGGRGNPGGLPDEAFEGLVDLTPEEAKQVQAVVEEGGEPLWVVGGVAKGKRHPGSDIDYYYEGNAWSHPFDTSKLPGFDPRHGILGKFVKRRLGPGILFQPGKPPEFHP
jgi:RHS repeat-associated protein